MTEHCGCCLRGQGFGPRRLRVLLLLLQHPELDLEHFRGFLHAESHRSGMVRGEVRERALVPLVEPSLWRVTLASSEAAARPSPPI
jgi:hypothetical protein